MVDEGNMIVEGKYLDPLGVMKYGQISIEGGMIDAVGRRSGIADLRFGDDFVILPGFIDIHVHGRQFALPWRPDADTIEKYQEMLKKETFSTVCDAAVNGGVVAIGLMPNDPVPPSRPESYRAKELLAGRECTIDHVLYALMTEDVEPFGDVPYKLYTHDFSQRAIRDMLQRFASLDYDPLICVHAENRQVLSLDDTRPAEAEVRDVGFVLDLADKHGLSVHFAHVSTARGLDLIVQARRQGTKVSCETAPHYLYFTKESAKGVPNSDYIFMKPPLREDADRERLLEGVVSGEIDCIATDHAPHTPEQKDAGAFGIPVLDNYTHFVGWLLQNRVSERRVIEACCGWPGRFVGRYTGGRYGSISEGSVGSLVVLGRKGQDGLAHEPVKTKCGWSAFQGAKLGDDYLLYANTTIVRGVPLKYGLDDAA